MVSISSFAMGYAYKKFCGLIAVMMIKNGG